MDEKTVLAILKSNRKVYETKLAEAADIINEMIRGLEIVLDHGEMSDPVRTHLEAMCRTARAAPDLLDAARFEKGLQNLLRDEPE